MNKSWMQYLLFTVIKGNMNYQLGNLKLALNDMNSTTSYLWAKSKAKLEQWIGTDQPGAILRGLERQKHVLLTWFRRPVVPNAHLLYPCSPLMRNLLHWGRRENQFWGPFYRKLSLSLKVCNPYISWTPITNHGQKGTRASKNILNGPWK